MSTKRMLALSPLRKQKEQNHINISREFHFSKVSLGASHAYGEHNPSFATASGTGADEIGFHFQSGSLIHRLPATAKPAKRSRRLTSPVR